MKKLAEKTQYLIQPYELSHEIARNKKIKREVFSPPDTIRLRYIPRIGSVYLYTMLALLIWPVTILMKAVTDVSVFVAGKFGNKNKDEKNMDKDMKIGNENDSDEEENETDRSISEMRELTKSIEAKREETESKIEEMKKAIVSEREKTKAIKKKILNMKIQSRIDNRSGYKFQKEEHRRWKEALRL